MGGQADGRSWRFSARSHREGHFRVCPHFVRHRSRLFTSEQARPQLHAEPRLAV
jgi:hypothetical protein